jgi:hypothetical protein
MDSKGVTNTENIEQILGLLWNFETDTLLPNLNVYFCKKRRGEHVDVPLNQEVITKTDMNLWVLLRAVGSLYDLSGRFLNPLQMKGRQLYSKTTKLGLKWDEPVAKTSPEISKEISDFMQEIILVKETLKVMPRAWVPEHHMLVQLISSYDGSMNGYSSTVHARSSKDNSNEFESRVATGCCKLSQLDVGDNELSGSLLAGRLVASTLDAMPEIPTNLIVSFLGDSQCTGFSHNPALSRMTEGWRIWVLNGAAQLGGFMGNTHPSHYS